MEATTKTHMAIVTVPVYSHLRSIIEFCKRLVHRHQDIHITIVNPTFVDSPCPNVQALYQNLPQNMEYKFLPPVNVDDLHDKPHPALLVQATINRSLPTIRDELNALHSRLKLVAIVCDGLLSQVLAMANELNVLSYAYFPSTAMLLSLCLYPEVFDKADSSDTIEIPGCIPLPFTDLPDPVQDRVSEEYKVFLEGNSRFYLAHGVIINSFFDLEPETFKDLQEKEGIVPFVYPIGPFIIQEEGNDTEYEYMKWLDKQEPNSVLYVSFGSAGTLTQDQVNELAVGLELSGEKFLWVLRPPHKLETRGVFGGEDEDPLQFLPNGFLERIEGQGLIVPYWANQIQVIGHSAIGGFLSHCGWNSSLESIVHGVPLIAWPLFAEQKMNAALLTDGLKVAVRPKPDDQTEVVGREQIVEAVKNVLVGEEGKGIRNRMKKLQEVALDAIKEDGSSTDTLTQLALKWKSLALRQEN